MARKTIKKDDVQNINNNVNENVNPEPEQTTAEPTVTENTAPASRTLQDVIDSQVTTRRTRNGNYVEYSSKKKLFAANILSDELKATIEQLKNTFSFSAHKDNSYLIITLYDREAKAYKFLIVNMANQEVETAESIKLAKIRVAELTKTPKVA